MYRRIKNSQVFKDIMTTSAQLQPFEPFFMKKDKDGKIIDDDSFIKKEPGQMLQPLIFCSIDLKLLWNTLFDECPSGKKFIYSLIKNIYFISHDIYEVAYTPDVNIDEFSNVLVSTIGKLRTHPELNRCGRAFDVIENSVNLLKTNFTEYFRSCVETENTATLLESFIIDVSRTQKASPTVIRQFRQITNYMAKNAKNNNDPRVKKLFKMLNIQFGKIDKELKVDTQIKESEIIDEKTNTIVSLDEVQTNIETSIQEDLKIDAESISIQEVQTNVKSESIKEDVKIDEFI
jgi:hypothetical protein